MGIVGKVRRLPAAILIEAHSEAGVVSDSVCVTAAICCQTSAGKSCDPKLDRCACV
jgi:hypothetical protein